MASAARSGIQGEVAAQRQLGVSPVHGSLVRHPTRPEPGRLGSRPAPHDGLGTGLPDRLGQFLGTVTQPVAERGRMVRGGRGRRLPGIGRSGGPPGHRLGREPVRLAEMLGEPVQRPFRAGRHVSLQVSIPQRRSELGGLRDQRVKVAIIVQQAHQASSRSCGRLAA
jgi:hypothetical protein